MILFRCHNWGGLMTDPKRNKDKEAGKLSATARKLCSQRHIELKHDRRKFMSNKYIEKGLMVEEDALTLLSRTRKIFLKKNEERLSNDFITGIPDTYEGESIYKADIIHDVKASYDIWTFDASRSEDAEDAKAAYFWQGQGYMDLTGAKEFHLHHCLINTPDLIINKEKQRLMWNMGVIDDMASPLYQAACDHIDRESNFDNIPMEERIHTIVIPRDDEAIKFGHERVVKAREFIREKYNYK